MKSILIWQLNEFSIVFGSRIFCENVNARRKHSYASINWCRFLKINLVFSPFSSKIAIFSILCFDWKIFFLQLYNWKSFAIHIDSRKVLTVYFLWNFYFILFFESIYCVCPIQLMRNFQFKWKWFIQFLF